MGRLRPCWCSTTASWTTSSACSRRCRSRSRGSAAERSCGNAAAARSADRHAAPDRRRERSAVGDAIDPPIRVDGRERGLERAALAAAPLAASTISCGARCTPRRCACMLLHCCYKGEERRGEPRVAVGFDVSFRAGLRDARARRWSTSRAAAAGCCRAPRSSAASASRVELPEALETGRADRRGRRASCTSSGSRRAARQRVRLGVRVRASSTTLAQRARS